MNPGSILPDRTTTTGDSLPVTYVKPFHTMRAEVTIIPVTNNPNYSINNRI